MGKIVLQFSTTKNSASRIIQWYSAGKYAHVDSVMPDWHPKAGWLLGSRSDHPGDLPAGVQIRPPDYHAFKEKLVLTIPCSDKKERAYYAALEAEVGKPYDSMAIWAFALDRHWRSEGSWICSELVAKMLEESKVFVHCLYLEANKIMPVTLLLALSAIVDVRKNSCSTSPI